MLIYGICFSLSNLLLSVWEALGSSTSLQLTQIYSYLWLSNIPLHKCTTTSLSIYLSMNIWVASMSWLLYTVLQWTVGHMCLLELWFSQSTCPVVGLLGHMVDLLLCAMLCLVTQLCLTLCNPVDCSWPGSFVHGGSPGKNIGVGCHAFLQEIFPTQGSNPGLPHCRWILYQLSHQGSPRILEWVAYPFSRGSSRPRNRTRVSCIAGRFFTSWATRKATH